MLVYSTAAHQIDSGVDKLSPSWFACTALPVNFFFFCFLFFVALLFFSADADDAGDAAAYL